MFLRPQVTSIAVKINHFEINRILVIPIIRKYCCLLCRTLLHCYAFCYCFRSRLCLFPGLFRLHSFCLSCCFGICFCRCFRLCDLCFLDCRFCCHLRRRFGCHRCNACGHHHAGREDNCHTLFQVFFIVHSYFLLSSKVSSI